MTEPCKAVVIYKVRQTMSHHNFNSQVHNKGAFHLHQTSRQAEGHTRPELEREESEASAFSGSSSTFAEDGAAGNVPASHQVLTLKS